MNSQFQKFLLTGGAQQIARENVETITFYRNMILGANGIYFLIMTIIGAAYQTTEISMFLLALLVYVGSFQFLFRLGTPKTSEPDGKGNPNKNIFFKPPVSAVVDFLDFVNVLS